jgi:hypothetical protein
VGLLIVIAAAAGPAVAQERTSDPGDPGPASGGIADPLDPVLSGGSPEGLPIPLREDAPAWLTPDLLAQVLRSNEPVPAPEVAPLPGQVGIRPGSWMVSPYWCTMNFVFRKGSLRGIGTAGHCVEKVGEPVVVLTVLPGTSQPVLVNVGPVLVRRNGGVGNDFALVKVRAGLHQYLDPEIAVIGGPCGVNQSNVTQVVAHYGHGVGPGTGGTARAGVAGDWRANAYGFAGAAYKGDSGSPVRVIDYRAAGNLTHLIVGTNWLHNFIVGTRITKILNIISDWKMVSPGTCPITPDSDADPGQDG